MPRKLVLVGIDPGTTTAVVLVDLKGNIILSHSRRGFPVADLRDFVLRYGNPLLVCNDISPVQKAAARIAASFGVRTFFPEEPVSRREKKRFLKEHTDADFANEHERDAAFAALFAWDHIRSLLERVDRRLAKFGLEEELGAVIKKGVLTRKVNITTQIRDFLRSREGI